MQRAPMLRVMAPRSCPSGRARFRTERAALAVVGTQLVEPGDPHRVIVPVGVDDTRCGMCRGWHARAPWSPFAVRGSRAARTRRGEDLVSWPAVVPAPTAPPARHANRVSDVRRDAPALDVECPPLPVRGRSALDEARRALGA